MFGKQKRDLRTDGEPEEATQFDDREDVAKRMRSSEAAYAEFRAEVAKKRAEAKEKATIREANAKLHAFADNLPNAVAEFRAAEETQAKLMEELKRQKSKRMSEEEYFAFANDFQKKYEGVMANLVAARSRLEVSFPEGFSQAMLDYMFKDRVAGPRASGIRRVVDTARRLRLGLNFKFYGDSVDRHYTGVSAFFREGNKRYRANEMDVTTEQVPSPEEEKLKRAKELEEMRAALGKLKELFAELPGELIEGSKRILHGKSPEELGEDAAAARQVFSHPED
jgi:hypothetical protein